MPSLTEAYRVATSRLTWSSNTVFFRELCLARSSTVHERLRKIDRPVLEASGRVRRSPFVRANFPSLHHLCLIIHRRARVGTGEKSDEVTLDSTAEILSNISKNQRASGVSRSSKSCSDKAGADTARSSLLHRRRHSATRSSAAAADVLRICTRLD